MIGTDHTFSQLPLQEVVARPQVGLEWPEVQRVLCQPLLHLLGLVRRCRVLMKDVLCPIGHRVHSLDDNCLEDLKVFVLVIRIVVLFEEGHRTAFATNNTDDH